MSKHVLETLSHLLDFCEAHVARLGVNARSELEPILNEARESYSKALEAFHKPAPKPKTKPKKAK